MTAFCIRKQLCPYIFSLTYHNAITMIQGLVGTHGRMNSTENCSNPQISVLIRYGICPLGKHGSDTDAGKVSLPRIVDLLDIFIENPDFMMRRGQGRKRRYCQQI